jgi:4-alpha-glucanotransferase
MTDRPDPTDRNDEPDERSTELPAELEAQLAVLGISSEYEDAFGDPYRLDVEAAEQLVRAMDVAPDAGAPPGTDAVIVTRPDAQEPCPSGELVLEDGSHHTVTGRLPAGLPLGYHDLRRTDGETTSIIVSPGRCRPHPERIWGWSVQLYATTSERSWGVGDLADLRELGEWSSAVGAGVVLVNPVDAVVPESPREDSPYFPSSRRFRDPLYLRIEEVPGADTIAGELPALAVRTRRDDHRIDRGEVVAAKLEALEQIWDRAPDAGREPGFVDFRTEQGVALEQFATFEALAEQHGGGWSVWPETFHDPDGPSVAAFAEKHADRVDFHAWIQWLLDEQLRAAGAASPLMRDLPIGVDPDGADAWVWQDVFATGVTVGAPPDELGPSGQDWQVPAFVPWKLRAARYEPFIDTIRAAFRHAAALRIDHVLGLFRLFWVPPGGPTVGSYVQQDTDALLDILALESHRADAYVVGEDLGTVGPGVRDELVDRAMLRYRVFWFEEAEPETWDARGLGAVTTHDLPAIGGLWTRADLEVHRDLGLEVDEKRIERMRTDLAERAGVDPNASTADACVAAARLIAGAGCDVVVIQLEDAIGATHRINIPGTDREARPDNWSLTLPVPLDELPTHGTVTRVLAALQEQRPARS